MDRKGQIQSRYIRREQVRDKKKDKITPKEKNNNEI